MSQLDSETRAFVEEKSGRMVSLAMYRRLKAVVDSWVREERGKARVATGAIVGLVVLFAGFVAAAFVLPTYAPVVGVIGFMAWLGFVVALIRRHLGAPR